MNDEELSLGAPEEDIPELSSHEEADTQGALSSIVNPPNNPGAPLQIGIERLKALSQLKAQMKEQAAARQAAMERVAQAYQTPVDTGLDPGLIALGRGIASKPASQALAGFTEGMQGMADMRQKLAEREWARNAAAAKVRAEAEQQNMADILNQAKLDVGMTGYGRASAHIREYTNNNNERVQVITNPYTGESTQTVLGKAKDIGVTPKLKAGFQWVKNPDGTPKLDEQGLPVQAAITNISKTTGIEPSLSPEALNDAAVNYNKSGTLPPNMGRGTQGAANSTAIQNLAAKLRREQGLDPDRLLDIWGIRKGQTGAYADISKRVNKIDLAVNEGLSSMQITRDAMNKLPRTTFPALNGGMQFFDKHMGDPDLRAAQASINTFVNTYARAINPTGQSTISDKDHARELLSTVDSPQAFDAVMGILEREMHTAKESSHRTLQEAEPRSSDTKSKATQHPKDIQDILGKYGAKP